MAAYGESNAAPDPTDLLVSYWSRWMEQSTRGTQAILEAIASSGDSKQLQRRWLDAFAESAENFFRTPAFLGLMKQQLKLVTDLKSMQDQVIRGTARQIGLPLAEDISGLFERLNSAERKILSRIGEIESRVKVLEEKLGGASAATVNY